MYVTVYTCVVRRLCRGQRLGPCHSPLSPLGQRVSHLPWNEVSKPGLFPPPLPPAALGLQAREGQAQLFFIGTENLNGGSHHCTASVLNPPLSHSDPLLTEGDPEVNFFVCTHSFKPEFQGNLVSMNQETTDLHFHFQFLLRLHQTVIDGVTLIQQKCIFTSELVSEV